jgi:hypothetical protein
MRISIRVIACARIKMLVVCHVCSIREPGFGFSTVFVEFLVSHERTAVADYNGQNFDLRRVQMITLVHVIPC